MAPTPSKKRRRIVSKPSLIGFQAGHHCIVSGASGRGKTWYTVDAILGQGHHKGFDSPWDAVIVCCDGISLKQPVFQKLQKEFTGKGGVTMVEDLPGKDEEKAFMGLLEKNFNNKYKTLLLIDDLMTASKSGHHERFVDRLFTSARHFKTDVWELTQAHTGNRTRRLNCGYLCCFATPSDVKSLAHICASIRPETKGHDLLAAYRVATESHDGHGCLVMCLNQPNEFMFRNTDMRTCIDLAAL